MMTLGSLFDGSGGFPLAGALSGIVPVWASEVEPYPIAVTRSRFPRMRHLGSVTEIHGGKIEPVDVITFGSPCQDMSVAGKRAGIHEGKRSNLFFEAIRIIKEMREKTHGRYPTFAVWENVPGAFSSNKGEDFRCVLEAFARICGGEDVSIPRPARGKWNAAGEIVGAGYSVAWRTLDAQYWGVPQRRKRIYLVADFRGGRAGEILFERESVRGNPAQSGTPGQGASADAAGSAGGSSGVRGLNPIYTLQGNGIDRADTAGCNGKGWREDVSYTLNTIDRPAIYFKAGQGANARSIGASETVTPTLGSEAGGNSVPSVCYPQIARTLTAANSTPCIDRGCNIVCYDARGNGDGEKCPTLTGDHENRVTDYTALCCMDSYAVDCRNATLDAKKTHTLQAKASGGQSVNCTPSVLTQGKPPRKYIIRRLTPLECCRLQGFPDGWGVPDSKPELSADDLAFWQGVRDTCAIISGKAPKTYSAASLTKWYNALHTDSAEYKMWGNGIALPCAAFVLEGIAETMKEVANNG